MSAQYKDGKFYGTGASPMPAEDMSEVASPMPSVMSRRFKYSTEEQVVGEWIDGKPLYQKTISNITLAQGDNNILIDSNVDTIISVIGRATKDTIEFIPIPCASTNVAYTIETWTYDSTSIDLATGASRAGAIATITVQYTKTTD